MAFHHAAYVQPNAATRTAQIALHFRLMPRVGNTWNCPLQGSFLWGDVSRKSREPCWLWQTVPTRCLPLAKSESLCFEVFVPDLYGSSMYVHLLQPRVTEEFIRAAALKMHACAHRTMPTSWCLRCASDVKCSLLQTCAG